jgi:hypothetical protein
LEENGEEGSGKESCSEEGCSEEAGEEIVFARREKEAAMPEGDCRGE